MAGLNTTRDGRNPGSAGNITPGSGQNVPQRNLTPTYPSQANMGNKYSGLQRTNRASSYAPSQNNTYSTTQDSQTRGRTFNLGQDQQGNIQGASNPTRYGPNQIPRASLGNYSRGLQDVINDPTKGQDVAPVLSSNIAHFLDPNNPINQHLSQQALGQANRRGLANSSMAISASQQAILERASQLGMDATTMGNENWARNLGLSKEATDDQFKKDVTTTELTLEQRRFELEAREQINRNKLADANIRLTDTQRDEIYANMAIKRDTYNLDNRKFLEEQLQNETINAQRDKELADLRAKWETEAGISADDITQREAQWRSQQALQDAQFRDEMEKKYEAMGEELALKAKEIEAKYPKNADGTYVHPDLVKDFRVSISRAWDGYRKEVVGIMSQEKIRNEGRTQLLHNAADGLLSEINIYRKIAGMDALTRSQLFSSKNGLDALADLNFTIGGDWGNPGGTAEEDDDEDDDEE